MNQLGILYLDYISEYRNMFGAEQFIRSLVEEKYGKHIVYKDSCT
ncbi:MAG: hypothetical protein R2680_08665 [Nitrososphaeraceae archaeon]